jgi:enoyl-CoA hydratase/carnithine racemase
MEDNVPSDTAPELFAGGKLRLHRGRIAILELNQPEKRNAISQDMWQAFPDICAAIEADAAIKVLVVKGAGGHAFSAGADISEFAMIYADAASARRANDAIRLAQARLRSIDRPTLAMIDGVCIGGGLGVALACDFRFSAPAAKYAITPARLGLAYSFHDTAQLVEKVGAVRAKDILFSARLLAAEEALAFGLIDRLHPAEQLMTEVMIYAEQLAGLSQTSIRTAKAVVNGISDALLADAGRYAAMVDSSFDGQDFQEGYKAFLEKRSPNF